jgi:hypothetical protein
LTTFPLVLFIAAEKVCAIPCQTTIICSTHQITIERNFLLLISSQNEHYKFHVVFPERKESVHVFSSAFFSSTVVWRMVLKKQRLNLAPVMV